MMALSTSFTGCLTNDNKDTTKAPVDTTPKAIHTAFGSETTVSVGAQGHATYGTAVDLDTKTVMLSAAANAAQGSIDILFVFSSGSLKIASPVAAKAAGDVALAANYDAAVIKDVKFLKVSAKPADSEAAAAAFAAGSTVDIMTVAAGDQFIVKTGAGKIVYLKIATIAGTDKGAAADLTIAISGL